MVPGSSGLYDEIPFRVTDLRRDEHGDRDERDHRGHDKVTQAACESRIEDA